MRELLRHEIAPLKLEIEKISKTPDDLQTTVSLLSNKYDDLLSQCRPRNWQALSCFITKVTLSKAPGKTLMSLGRLRTKQTCKQKSWLSTSDVTAWKSQEEPRKRSSRVWRRRKTGWKRHWRVRERHGYLSFASYSQFQYYGSIKDNWKIYKKGNRRSILL